MNFKLKSYYSFNSVNGLHQLLSDLANGPDYTKYNSLGNSVSITLSRVITIFLYYEPVYKQKNSFSLKYFSVTMAIEQQGELQNDGSMNSSPQKLQGEKKAKIEILVLKTFDKMLNRPKCLI